MAVWGMSFQRLGYRGYRGYGFYIVVLMVLGKKVNKRIETCNLRNFCNRISSMCLSDKIKHIVILTVAAVVLSYIREHGKSSVIYTCDFSKPDLTLPLYFAGIFYTVFFILVIWALRRGPI